MIYHSINGLLYIYLTLHTFYDVNYLYCKPYGIFMTSVIGENKRSYHAVHIHRIVDGKIVEHKAIHDDLSLMVQLGGVGRKSDRHESLFQAWKAWKGL